MINPEGSADAGALLARVIRLDPGAVVRLRPAAAGTVALWCRLPFGVLVSRRVPGSCDGDMTVHAEALLALLSVGGAPAGGSPAGGGPADAAWPARDDAAWRWPLPPVDGARAVERLPAAEVRRLSAAAADTVRSAAAGGVGGRAVGSRALRDALLNHVPVIVTTDGGERIAVGQRLIQAVTRMGFVAAAGRPGEPDVTVLTAGPWVGLAAAYGSAWHRTTDALMLRPLAGRTPPNG